MHGEVGDEVGRRQDRVDQAGRGEQRRVGDVRPGQIVGGVGVVQPPVQVVELVVELGGEPVGGRDGDAAARAATRMPRADRLGEAVPVGQAAHLHRRRVRALASRSGTARRSCGTPRPPPPGAPGCTARRGGRCAPRSAWRSRPGRSAAARPPAARSPARSPRSTPPGRRRAAAAPPPDAAPPASSTASTTGRYCSAATANNSGTAGQPPRHRQLQGASPLRVQPAPGPPRGCGRGETAPPRAPRAPPPAGPRRGRAPARCSTTPAGSPVAVCSTLSSARPPRHAIASTICRDGAGMASTRAASSPATSDRPR